jgi:hypothetical protein
LFSGLLVAVSSFAKNMIGENIHEIRTEHHHIIYESKEAVLLAIVTAERGISKRKMSNIIRTIYNAFIRQYQEHLDQEIVEPQIYEKFSDTIDNILQKSGVVKKNDVLLDKEIISGIH